MALAASLVLCGEARWRAAAGGDERSRRLSAMAASAALARACHVCPSCQQPVCTILCAFWQVTMGRDKDEHVKHEPFFHATRTRTSHTSPPIHLPTHITRDCAASTLHTRRRCTCHMIHVHRRVNARRSCPMLILRSHAVKLNLPHTNFGTRVQRKLHISINLPTCTSLPPPRRYELERAVRCPSGTTSE